MKHRNPGRACRASLAFCALIGLVGGISAQATDFEAYLKRVFPAHSRLTVQKFLRRAAADGLVSTPQLRGAAKRAWRNVVLEGRRIRLGQLAPASRVSGRRASPNAAVVTEKEYNGTQGFADQAGVLSPAGLQLDGRIAAADETDTFAFRTVVDGLVDLQLKGRGAQLARGELALFNDRGYLVQTTGSRTLPSGVAMELPRGLYFATISGTAPGDYRVDCGFQVQPIATLPTSGTTSVMLGTTAKRFRVVLARDGVFDLKIQGGSLDSYLVLYNARMSYVYEVDDASTSTATDAGLLAQLPAGTYFLSLEADASGAATVTTKFTAQPVPALACPGTAAGSIPGGEEDFQLYRVALTTAQETRFQISPRGSTNALGDSLLFLYGTEMGQITDSDDDFAFVGSVVSGTLPKGTFYAASTGFWCLGDYTMATRCSAPAMTPVGVGTTTAGNIAQRDGGATFLVDLGTAAGLEFRIFEQTLPDAQLGIVDAATGVALGYNDDADFGPADSEVARRYEKGRYHVLVKDYCGDTGTFDLTVRAPKFRGAANRLRGLGKSGQFAILIASIQSTPGFAIAPYSGLFRLDLATTVVVGPTVIPADGEVDFGFAFPPNLSAVLQSLHLDPAGPTGEFTNVLR